MLDEGVREGGIDWVARARSLGPLLEAAAARIDAARELPPDVVAALYDTQLYRMLLPRAYGGGETDVVTFIATLETVAAADASTAWCLGQASGCAISAAFLEPAVAREIFGPREAVLAWGPPAAGARADAVDGGYRVNGTWQFASGSRHATWLGATVAIHERDGSPRRTPGGAPVLRTIFTPRERATILDVWHVSGLRGTGSDSYTLTDVIVAEDHTQSRVAAERRETGTLYAFSSINIHALAFSAVALGIARAALDALLVLAHDKRPRRGTTTLRENAAVQGRIGFAEAQLRAARAFLFASARDAWAAAGETGEVSLERRIEMRMASTYAIAQARAVVETAYTTAGATAIFENQPFERRFRDVNAVAQQIQGHLSNFETVGQHLLGLPNDLSL